MPKPLTVVLSLGMTLVLGQAPIYATKQPNTMKSIYLKLSNWARGRNPGCLVIMLWEPNDDYFIHPDQPTSAALNKLIDTAPLSQPIYIPSHSNYSVVYKDCLNGLPQQNEHVLAYHKYIDQGKNGKSPIFNLVGGMEQLVQAWDADYSAVLQFKAGEVVDKTYETEDIVAAEAFAKATPYPFSKFQSAYDPNDEVTLDVKVVGLERPWLDRSMLKDGFPRLVTHLILTKRTKIHRKTSTSSGNTEATSSEPRVLGLVCEPYKIK